MNENFQLSMIVEKNQLPEVLITLNKLDIKYTLSNTNLHLDLTKNYLTGNKLRNQIVVDNTNKIIKDNTGKILNLEPVFPLENLPIKEKKLSPIARKIMSYCRDKGDHIDIRIIEQSLSVDGYSKTSASSGIKELIKSGYFARIGRGKYVRTIKK